jgi:hypothetical protein
MALQIEKYIMIRFIKNEINCILRDLDGSGILRNEIVYMCTFLL